MAYIDTEHHSDLLVTRVRRKPLSSKTVKALRNALQYTRRTGDEAGFTVCELPGSPHLHAGKFCRGDDQCVWLTNECRRPGSRNVGSFHTHPNLADEGEDGLSMSDVAHQFGASERFSCVGVPPSPTDAWETADLSCFSYLGTTFEEDHRYAEGDLREQAPSFGGGDTDTEVGRRLVGKMWRDRLWLALDPKRTDKYVKPGSGVHRTYRRLLKEGPLYDTDAAMVTVDVGDRILKELGRRRPQAFGLCEVREEEANLGPWSPRHLFNKLVEHNLVPCPLGSPERVGEVRFRTKGPFPTLAEANKWLKEEKPRLHCFGYGSDIVDGAAAMKCYLPVDRTHPGFEREEVYGGLQAYEPHEETIPQVDRHLKDAFLIRTMGLLPDSQPEPGYDDDAAVEDDAE